MPEGPAAERPRDQAETTRDVGVPVRATPMRVQRKLAVGAANDPAEYEADQLADQAMAALRAGGSERAAISPVATGRIARSATAGGGFEVDADTEQRIHAARSDQRSLPAGIRRSMEGAFGADFSGVRLHVGPDSDDLNERVQARAFTLGSDVFVRRADYAPGTDAGQRLIAHELAHTVQQGASRVQSSDGTVLARKPTAVQRVIRRSPAMDIVNSVRADLDRTRQLPSKDRFDPKKFKESTNTRGHQRGAALKAIDAYLLQYQPIANDPAKNDERLKLLVQMQYAAEQWILDHSVKDEAGSRVLKQDSTTGAPKEAVTNKWLIDPNRKGRFAGMAFFLENVTIEVANTKRVMADTDTDDQTLEKVEADGGGASGSHKKLKAKYDGDPTSTLTKLGALVEMAVPNEGDQSEIEAAFRWPVDPSGVAFVGGTLRLKAQNSSPPGTATGAQGAKNILARAELVFTFGAQWLNIGKIQAEIGGYIESSAKTGRETMTLMSYLLYRKCRESYVMPREVTSYLWGGGRKGTFGAIKSEQWSKDVETAIIGDNDNAYAQSGMLGGVGAEGQLGNESIGGGGSVKVSGGGGTRYDKASIEKVKQLGAANERSDKAVLSTAQKELGRGVRFLAFEVAGNVGPFKGQVQVRISWEKDAATYEVKAAELEFQAGAKVPNVGGDQLGERIAGWATEGVKTLVSKVRAAVGAQADKQKIKDYEAYQQKVKAGTPPAGKMTSFTEKERGEAAKGSAQGEIFGSVLDGLDQLRNISAVEKLANPSPAVNPTWLGGAADKAPSNFHSNISNSDRFSSQVGERSMTSSIGLNMALGGDLIGKSFQLSFNFEKARQFSIPMFLDVSQKATTRLVAFRYESGKWAIL